MSEIKAAVFGAGAMGTVLGAYLTRAGADVLLITRNSGHVEALNRCGAHITGTADFTVKVKAATPDEVSGKFDVVFLMTKQRENAAVTAEILGMLSEGGVICTMQNGMPENSVAAVAGEQRTLGCALSWGARCISEGVVQLTSEPKKMNFALGALTPDNPAVKKVAALLSLAGKVKTPKNFVGARYAKLAVNSAFSPLSALTGMTFGQVASTQPAKSLAHALLCEAFAAAKAAGIKIARIQGHNIAALYGHKKGPLGKLSLALIPLAMKSHGDGVSGMYYDLKNGKKCDMEFICGEVSRLARLHGVKTPLTDAVLNLTFQVENGGQTLGPDILSKLARTREKTV